MNVNMIKPIVAYYLISFKKLLRNINYNVDIITACETSSSLNKIY